MSDDPIETPSEKELEAFIGRHGTYGRREFMTRAVGLGFSLSAAAALYAAGAEVAGGAIRAAPKIYKGMAHTIINIASLQTGVQGFKFAWEALHQKFLIQNYDFDPQKALAQAELFGGLGVNVNWGYLISDSLLGPYVNTLAKQKIAYVNVGNPIPWVVPSDPKYKGAYLQQVGASFSDEAYMAARALFQSVGGKGELIWLTGAKGTAGDISRSTGVQIALKQFPGIKVAAKEPANWDLTKGQQLTEQLIPANSKANMVFGQNDSIAIGAVQALRSLGKKDVHVAGVDGDPQFLQMIVDGDLAVATSASRVDYQGVIIAARLFDHVMGSGNKWDPLEGILRQDDVLVDTPAAAKALLAMTKGKLPYDPKLPSRHLNPKTWKTQTLFQVLDPYFEWVHSIPTKPPRGFKWPAAYKAALNPSHAKAVNARWKERNKDVFAGVRAKAKYKGPVLFYLANHGLVPGGYKAYKRPAGYP